MYVYDYTLKLNRARLVASTLQHFLWGYWQPRPAQQAHLDMRVWIVIIIFAD